MRSVVFNSDEMFAVLSSNTRGFGDGRERYTSAPSAVHLVAMMCNSCNAGDCPPGAILRECVRFFVWSVHCEFTWHYTLSDTPGTILFRILALSIKYYFKLVFCIKSGTLYITLSIHSGVRQPCTCELEASCSTFGTFGTIWGHWLITGY
jgi:hypothetical protein